MDDEPIDHAEEARDWLFLAQRRLGEYRELSDIETGAGAPVGWYQTMSMAMVAHTHALLALTDAMRKKDG